jgi:hypothetical protein
MPVPSISMLDGSGTGEKVTTLQVGLQLVPASSHPMLSNSNAGLQLPEESQEVKLTDFHGY